MRRRPRRLARGEHHVEDLPLERRAVVIVIVVAIPAAAAAVAVAAAAAGAAAAAAAAALTYPADFVKEYSEKRLQYPHLLSQAHRSSSSCSFPLKRPISSISAHVPEPQRGAAAPPATGTRPAWKAAPSWHVS